MHTCMCVCVKPFYSGLHILYIFMCVRFMCVSVFEGRLTAGSGMCARPAPISDLQISSSVPRSNTHTPKRSLCARTHSKTPGYVSHAAEMKPNKERIIERESRIDYVYIKNMESKQHLSFSWIQKQPRN